MIDPQNIHSLTDFQRHTKEHIELLRESREPHVLTINGKAEVVIQNAEAYQKMLEELGYWNNVRELRDRLNAIKNGDQGRPVRDVLAEFAKEVNVDLD